MHLPPKLGLPAAAAVALGLGVLFVQAGRKKWQKQLLQKFDFRTLPEPSLTDDKLEFISVYTGITDLQCLKRHVLRVYKQIKSKLHVFRCIQEMMFLRPRIGTHPAYPALLAAAAAAGNGQAVQEGSTGFRVADIGCCLGQDVRRMVADGVPAQCIWAIDVHSGYWDMGLQLWMDDAKGASSRIAGLHTLFGDLTASSPPEPGYIDTSAQGLEASFDYVTALAVLHVLPEDRCQRLLARALSMLKPGGVLFGWCVGTTTPGGHPWVPPGAAGSSSGQQQQPRFLHAADSLTATLQRAGYVDVDVRNDVIPRDLISGAPADAARVRSWAEQDGIAKALLVFTAKAPASS